MSDELASLRKMAEAALDYAWPYNDSVVDDALAAHDFHAAANPAAILGLIDRIEALERWADRMPDAGITVDDPRLEWWYRRPTANARRGRND